MVRGLLLFLLTTHCLAQTATLEGTTLGGNHEPISGTTVILVPIGATTEEFHRQTTSNISGRFSFANIPPGRYSLQAMNEGYADFDLMISGITSAWAAKGPWKLPEPLQIGPGQILRGFEIQLTPKSILSGKVLDEDGHPIPDASVHAYTARFVGNGRLLPARTGEEAKTNKSGEYQLSVDPGRRWHVGVEVDSPGYPLTFYPGARDLSTAIGFDTTGQPISGLNFQLSKGPLLHIRGTVTGSPPTNFRVVYWQETGEARPDHVTRIGNVKPDGSFDIPNLTPGDWTLDIRIQFKEKNYGRRTVTLREGDLEDIRIPFTPPAEVSGKVIGGSLQVRLRPLETAIVTPGVRTASDGTFVLKDVEPAKYRFDLTPPAGHYIQSVMLGGRDCLETGLDLTSGGGAAGLQIIIGGAPGIVTGTVTKSDGGNASNAVVTLVPDGPPAESYRADRYLSVLSSATGQFVFQNVVPGRYRVQAWERLPLLPSPLNDRLIFPDPAFPRRFDSQSTVVTVEEGETKSATVVMIPLGAVQP